MKFSILHILAITALLAVGMGLAKVYPHVVIAALGLAAACFALRLFAILLLTKQVAFRFTAMVVFALVFYAASIGPVLAIHEAVTGDEPSDFLLLVYQPIIYLHETTSLSYPIVWYCNAWGVD